MSWLNDEPKVHCKSPVHMLLLSCLSVPWVLLACVQSHLSGTVHSRWSCSWLWEDDLSNLSVMTCLVLETGKSHHYRVYSLIGMSCSERVQQMHERHLLLKVTHRSAPFSEWQVMKLHGDGRSCSTAAQLQQVRPSVCTKVFFYRIFLQLKVV